MSIVNATKQREGSNLCVQRVSKAFISVRDKVSDREGDSLVPSAVSGVRNYGDEAKPLASFPCLTQSCWNGNERPIIYETCTTEPR